MKQILLAIDGETPSRSVFQYATDLCRQVRARLCILQFSRTAGLSSGLPRPLRQMLKNPDCPVPCEVALSSGSLETDLSDYIDSHHDIILTVYDPCQDKRHKSGATTASRIDRLKGKLQVPLVIVNAGKRPRRQLKQPSLHTST